MEVDLEAEDQEMVDKVEMEDIVREAVLWGRVVVVVMRAE